MGITCILCAKLKSVNNFYISEMKRQGAYKRCIECCKEYDADYKRRNFEKLHSPEASKKKSEYLRSWRHRNPEKMKKKYELEKITRKDYFREYSKRNKERIDAKSKVHYENNKERKAALRVEHRKINMPKIRETCRIYVKNRIANDPLFKLLFRLRSRTKEAFKVNRWHKNSKTEQLLGCSFEVAKIHLEEQFKEGMNWQNHGNGEGKWNIDHIIPMAAAKTAEELRLLCHYTNLQPLWSIDNFKKNASMPKNHTLKLAV